MSDNIPENMPENIKRHWHGNKGDRYEHLNAWTHGGSMGPANRAAWALTPEMMAADAKRRVRSPPPAPPQCQSTFQFPISPPSNKITQESASSANTANGGSPTTPSVNERRRSSASSGSGAGLFSSLSSQKRESVDSNMAARRASWDEQRQQGGFFSKLWEGYTRGGK
ncbi:hypothetical protein PEBR_13650 [Penicillium brasilianum]|uniref:Uncharacterized protein n=1 Tax=Penicillium brasilianum TaxID=104259 RepID=A0A1S9RSS4_PENBI|nr:hypothetical protein PEBR_13650 [Penicillium brasilianum]